MEFGDRITIDTKLKRKAKRELAEDGIRKYKVMKVWESVELPQEKEVIFLGTRTLSNGRRYHEDYGYSYRPTEHFQVALVCESPNKNPYYTTL